MLTLLDTLCRKVNRSLEYLLFGLGFSMALLVAVQVFFRYVLNSSLFWSEELARYMLVWLSFAGAGVAYFRNLHPGVDVLTSRLPAGGRRAARMLVHLVTMGLALVMVIAGTQFAWFVRMQITPALGLPKWVVLAVIPAGGLVLFLFALVFFLHTAAGRDQ